MKLPLPIVLVLFFLAFGIVGCERSAKEPAKNETLSDGTVANPNSFKRYGVKQGHIRLDFSGLYRGGEDLYWKDYGVTEARFINSEFLAENGIQALKHVTLSNGPIVIKAKPEQGTGLRYRDTFVDSLMKLEPMPSIEQMSRAALLASKHELIGKDSVLGLVTDVWHQKAMNAKLYLWNGIVIKREVVGGPAPHTLVATSIDTLTPVDPAKFELPKDLNITEQ